MPGRLLAILAVALRGYDCGMICTTSVKSPHEGFQDSPSRKGLFFDIGRLVLRVLTGAEALCPGLRLSINVLCSAETKSPSYAGDLEGLFASSATFWASLYSDESERGPNIPMIAGNSGTGVLAIGHMGTAGSSFILGSCCNIEALVSKHPVVSAVGGLVFASFVHASEQLCVYNPIAYADRNGLEDFGLQPT